MAAQRGVYTVSFSEVVVTSAQADFDLFMLDAAAEKPVEIVALFLGNKSEIGDAQDEMLSINIIRGHTTSGDGAAATPRLLDASDPAASFTAEVVAAAGVGGAIATGGTPVTLVTDTFNVRGGLQWIFPEIMRPKTQGADLMVVRLTSAAADDITLSGCLWVREL